MRMAMAIGAAALLPACIDGGQRLASEPATSTAHVHMGHVLTNWQDTLEQMGLLPTAQAEAEGAAHAGIATSRPDDPEWLKLHAGDVVNTVDPAVEAPGPGLGYGVRQPVRGVAQRVRLAAASGDASDTVELHAGHIEASAGNVVVWSEQVVGLGQQVQAASSAAAPLVAEMQTLARTILAGTDASGAGKVSWEEGDGGLAQAAQHMHRMQEGEGLA